ncbi:hypothetical protein R5R35_007259 [Gryllus longicercus]|uniref:Proteasome maturation protein n=1 Tax=Gryllus longicercus TaxID=2509291 RepID=A0AAN9W042_9ORTH|nr:Proteasome maturation protein [Gryllus bimaculatus]
MSLGFPPLKPQATAPIKAPVKEGHYGIPDPMIFGLGATTKEKLVQSHPLELSEAKYAENQFKMNMVTLRNVQGLHAPLRIGMELAAARRVGHLPFLSSSRAMEEVITGRDEEIGFEDILNTDEFREQMGRPSLVIEKYWG